MATFQTAYERLMRTVNRPLTETDVLLAAKDAINDAVMFLQRNHAYNYTERLTTLTYPVNTLQVDLGEICTGTLRDILSVQQLSSAGIVQGKPLKIMRYDQLQAIRGHYERTHTANAPFDISLDSMSLSGWNIEDAFRQDLVAFLVGQNLGLYPRPTSAAVELLVNCHIWLPELVADADTNFFLTYALDVVMMLALKSMHIYMKLDSRFAVSEQQVADSLAGLIAWDAQVMENSRTSIR